MRLQSQWLLPAINDRVERFDRFTRKSANAWQVLLVGTSDHDSWLCSRPPLQDALVGQVRLHVRALDNGVKRNVLRHKLTEPLPLVRWKREPVPIRVTGNSEVYEVNLLLNVAQVFGDSDVRRPTPSS